MSISVAETARKSGSSVKTRGRAPKTGLSKLTPLSASSRAMQVVEQLTQLILDGEFKEDELLPPERDLAVRLGVSRNILREATKILQSRGLLSIRHGVGTVVSVPGSEPMQHALSHALHGQADALYKLMEVRFSVEVEIASLAAQRATPEQLQKIRGVLDEMLENLDNPERYVELDMAFHLAMAEATQNNLFILVLEALTTLSQQARTVVLKAGFPTAISQQIHERIYLAVASGDAALASELMGNHLKISDDDVIHNLEASASD